MGFKCSEIKEVIIGNKTYTIKTEQDEKKLKGYQFDSLVYRYIRAREQMAEYEFYKNSPRDHDNAAGLGIKANQVNNFLNYIDILLENVSIDPIYRVDYDFKEYENNNQKILDIANMNDYWGQDIDRAYVNINFKITDSNFQIMKSNTLKFNLPNGLSIIKFNGTEEEIMNFTTTGYLEINAVCKCNANNWNGQVYPQLIL